MPRLHSRIVPLLSVALSACAATTTTATTSAAPSGNAAVTAPVPQAGLNAFDTGSLMRDIRVLAADSLLGRLPGTVGEARTIAYMTSQFQAIGAQPGNTDGTYIQKVPLVGITVTNSPTLTFTKGSETRTLKWRDDYVAWTKHVAPTSSIQNSDLIFVGYGVEAPEFNWDDYKGVDMTGRTMVVLVNDPPLADTTQFGGNRMTYYGRWTYKFEQGAKHHAAGVLIVHETGPAGYPFTVVQGNASEKFDVVTPDRNMSRSNIEGWITLDQAKALFAMAGQDFDALKAHAATREFRPVPLGVTASVTLENRLHTIDSHNIVAKIEGTDPTLKNEYVVYTAHWDHFGVGAPVNGDSIYNGAYDNASGTAGLLQLARAFKAAPPKRSILLISVTGEEQGLLGSQYYSVAPIYPLNRTAAVINMDELNVWGATRDLAVVGLGASELDDYARAAAAEQGRVLTGDPAPEKGYYYRSDHFNFAKVGVPAFDPNGGVDYIGKPAGWGLQRKEQYEEHDYHQPSDEIKPDWDLSGAVKDLQLFYSMGYRVANAATMPMWRAGNEFRAIREKSLQGAR